MTFPQTGGRAGLHDSTFSAGSARVVIDSIGLVSLSIRSGETPQGFQSLPGARWLNTPQVVDSLAKARGCAGTRVWGTPRGSRS